MGGLLWLSSLCLWSSLSRHNQAVMEVERTKRKSTKKPPNPLTAADNPKAIEQLIRMAQMSVATTDSRDACCELILPLPMGQLRSSSHSTATRPKRTDANPWTPLKIHPPLVLSLSKWSLVAPPSGVRKLGCGLGLKQAYPCFIQLLVDVENNTRTSMCLRDAFDWSRGRPRRH